MMSSAGVRFEYEDRQVWIRFLENNLFYNRHAKVERRGSVSIQDVSCWSVFLNEKLKNEAKQQRQTRQSLQ